MNQPRVVRHDEGVRHEPLWLFKNGSLSGGTFDFMVGQVPFHSGPPLHCHEEQHDTFYVLEGTLTLQVAEEILELVPGDFATVPPGVHHTFDNLDADQPTPTVINLMTPGGLDAFFVDMGRAEDPHDVNALKEIGRRNGVSFVGPTLAERFAGA